MNIHSWLARVETKRCRHQWLDLRAPGEPVAVGGTVAHSTGNYPTSSMGEINIRPLGPAECAIGVKQEGRAVCQAWLYSYVICFKVHTLYLESWGE